jgi:hypothetical protein
MGSPRAHDTVSCWEIARISHSQPLNLVVQHSTTRSADRSTDNTLSESGKSTNVLVTVCTATFVYYPCLTTGLCFSGMRLPALRHNVGERLSRRVFGKLMARLFSGTHNPRQLVHLPALCEDISVSSQYQIELLKFDYSPPPGYYLKACTRWALPW